MPLALGPKAACRFKRLEPYSRVTLVDQSALISYGGCGIPYFISGDVSDPAQLQSTSFNMLRDRNIVLICNTGVRSYEAQITLDQVGIRESYNLQGGMAAVKK